jgi:catalase
MKNSLTAGPHGPVVLQDTVLLEKTSKFTREKIPPRNVHALGTGAFGTFTVTNDISKYSKAKLFSQVGKTTNIFVRFSGVFTELGEADTQRDARGFAIKFDTEEGIWDLLAINTPVFNVRDMKQGPDAVHAFKRDPRTGDWNPSQTWDYAVNHPESFHQVLMMYTDRGGTPLSYRFMHSYGCNTFSLINSNNERVWVKFHIISPHGEKGLNSVQAKLIAGEDPNWLSTDLREAINRGDYPTWRFCCQIMTEEEGYRNPIAFDCTKAWSHKDYPLIDIGTITLNKNPIDHFTQVEQSAFSPARVPPGIGFSPDKLLQGRLLIYDDAQYHRIGPNFKQLPINRPHNVEPNTMYVGGNMHLDVKEKFPHYFPSSFGGPNLDPSKAELPLRCDGPVNFYDYPLEGTDADYYDQPGEFYRLMISADKINTCYNIATSLEKVSKEIVEKVLPHLYKIDNHLGQTVEELWKSKLEGTAKRTDAELLCKDLKGILIPGTKGSQ